MLKDGWSIEPFDPANGSALALWNALVAFASGSVVQRAEFVFSCAAAMGDAGIRLAVFRQAGEVAACALLKWRWGFPEIFIESQMPLGAWVQSANIPLETLAHGLLARVPFGLRLGMSQLDPRYAPRPSDGGRVSTLPYIETPWLDIEGSYADYWAARGKNLRSNMQKQRSKLVSQGIATRMEILGAAKDMARGVRDYALLESKGWKAEGGTAVSEHHPQTRFYREMLERFALQGQARIYRYFFGEQLVASELCLCAAGEFVILKTTYDESTAPLSPASLLRQEMFEGLFNEGNIRRVEFYGPLKDWHTRWTPLSRGIYHANVHSRAGASTLIQKIQAVRASRTAVDA